MMTDAETPNVEDMSFEEALDELPVEQRILIVLVHQYGYDYRSAGDVISIDIAQRDRILEVELTAPYVAGRTGDTYIFPNSVLAVIYRANVAFSFRNALHKNGTALTEGVL